MNETNAYRDDPFATEEENARRRGLVKDHPAERILRLPEVRAARDLSKKYDAEMTGLCRLVQDDEGRAWRKAIRAARRVTGLSRDDAEVVVAHAVHS